MIEIRIDDVDTASFETLPEIRCDTVYAKDENHVYYRGEIVKGADPESFEVYKSYYGRDRRHLYLGKEAYSLKGFRLIKNEHGRPWAVNADHVFYSGRVTLMDPHTFEIIEGPWESEMYARDHSYVYYEDHLVEEADPNTFKLAEMYYSSDAQNFYFQGEKIIGAEEDSLIIFTTFRPYYAKDSRYAYQSGVKMEGVDIATFESYFYKYTRDKNGVYFEGVLIPEADPDTFQQIELFKAKDKNYIFEDGRVIGPNDEGLGKESGLSEQVVIFKNKEKIPFKQSSSDRVQSSGKKLLWERFLSWIFNALYKLF